ncbi:hypothetical protein F4818DRAFT_443591 [Hypoxylon cercidicola]|nr:hypothetical protein F4818DRAFT_443591 [Hypoxylon cercidicola]
MSSSQNITTNPNPATLWATAWPYTRRAPLRTPRVWDDVWREWGYSFSVARHQSTVSQSRWTELFDDYHNRPNRENSGNGKGPATPTDPSDDGTAEASSSTRPLNLGLKKGSGLSTYEKYKNLKGLFWGRDLDPEKRHLWKPRSARSSISSTPSDTSSDIATSSDGSRPVTPTNSRASDEDEKPALTWDPTIWAPHSPDAFNPPGLAGVTEVREHGMRTAIPWERARITPRSEVQVLSRFYAIFYHLDTNQAFLAVDEYLDRYCSAWWNSLFYVFLGVFPAMWWHPIPQADFRYGGNPVVLMWIQSTRLVYHGETPNQWFYAD